MTQRVKIIEFEPHHLLSLDLQPEQKHLFDLFTTAKEIIEYGYALKMNAVDTDDNTKCAWTGIADGKIVGCGGIVKVQEHIGEAWTLFSDDFKKHAPRIAKEIRRQASIAKVERVYAYIDTGFERAERFIQWVGLEYEGTMRRSGTHKQDQKIYARIREI